MRHCRGKSKITNEWVYGWKVEYEFNGVVFTVIVDEEVDQYLPLVKRMVSVIPESVGQSTGLKDMEGVEIYEGDIVNWRTLRDSENSGSVGIVHWENSKATFNVEGFYETFQDCPCCAFSEHMAFKIIGNVTDDPELLQGKIEADLTLPRNTK